ncbi:DNA-3-methyladenine glycosylase family protein [Maritalea mediterranea]|uniref:DNA-3-methyladenine glycosylase II n=1 Tax=Maritalea mediterranea TaxID=2909667 RepID=A0ABS9EB59_9HYPH|nr:DNA-3-methyladenine glycosylase [Maritalea mediterranea]MCF4099427.1 DNA-3-methyladenine glycosylase [Maritalea mediterranea]
MHKERLKSKEVLAAHLDGLAARDPRLKPVIAQCEEVPLRETEDGFEGMAKIVVGQQVSVAAASAIWGRFASLMDNVCATEFLAHREEDVRGAGLSANKFRTLCAVAEAERTGDLRFEKLADLPPEEAIETLTRIKGIGPWTAEIYLLFCLGHPDIFPAGDLALQKMVGHINGLEDVPKEKETRALAEIWSPYRGAASRLMWRYFAVLRDKEGIVL